MQFSEIPGLVDLKNKLIQNARSGKVGHAQLFYHHSGGSAFAVAMAFAQYLCCDNVTESDSCGSCKSCKQFKSLNYPDLHFSFPFAKTKEAPTHATADFFMRTWHEFIVNTPFFTLNDWMETLSVENKQALIPVHESKRIVQKLNLKSYSGKRKIMLIWLPELMHLSAANKLLKTLEEPSNNSLILLVSENTEKIIQTISSRCQKVWVPQPKEGEISSYLVKQGIDEKTAKVSSHLAQGNIVEALSLAQRSERYVDYANFFKDWMRACYAAKTVSIFEFVENFARLDRERQKEALRFFLHVIEKSLGINFTTEESTHPLFEKVGMDLARFAPFVNERNQKAIYEAIDGAIADIARNGNSRIILSDISFKFSNLLRVKAA